MRLLNISISFAVANALYFSGLRSLVLDRYCFNLIRFDFRIKRRLIKPN